MMSISIRVVWIENIAKKLNKLWEKELEQAKEKRLKEVALLLERNSKKEAPVGSWKLRDSIESKISRDNALIYSLLPYAVFVHEWTLPHLIKPSTKKALYWQGAEHPVPYVNHPWTKANPFFTRAVENTTSKILERFNEIIWWLIN